jgi:hypothetical protein
MHVVGALCLLVVAAGAVNSAMGAVQADAALSARRLRSAAAMPGWQAKWTNWAHAPGPRLP